MRKWMLCALFLATLTAVATPAAADNSKAACSRIEEPHLLAKIFLATAEEAAAECIESGINCLDYECAQGCQDHCFTDWWECCSNCTPAQAMACDQAYNSCVYDCYCPEGVCGSPWNC